MKNKERMIWAAVVSVMVLAFSFLVFTPKVLAQSSEGATTDYLRRFETIFRFVENNYVYEVSPEALYEGALKGLFESLDDPHSTFLTKGDLRSLNSDTKGQYSGVGLYISKPAPGNDELLDVYGRPLPPYVEVIAPIEGTPAYRAGVHAGDLIVSIEEESTEEMTIDEVVDRLMGEAGTSVNISIQTKEGFRKNISIVRAVIEVPTIKSGLIDDAIGYIKIIKWTEYTPLRVKEVLADFEKEDVKGLIIDVRNNPGGLLDSAVDTCDLFLSSGTIVSTRSRIESENEVFKARTRVGISAQIPVIVLVNKGSASASEIFAGAIKDTDRGILMGSTTYGKGSVQWVRALGESGFKLTIAHYYTPSGINVDEVGIEPDQVVELDELSDEELEDYLELAEAGLIETFVMENSDPSSEEIAAFIRQLQRDGYALKDMFLGSAIRSAVNRTLDFPPIFDLEYDPVLTSAISLLMQSISVP